MDRHLELADPVGQDALDVVLPQPEPVGVPGGEVADVEVDPGEPCDLRHLSLREEPIGDPALVEDLDGARVQAAGARAGEVLAGAPLDDGDVDARQRQLARQHQPRRTSAGDHHRMLHPVTPFRGFRRHDGDCAARPGACRKPPGAPIMEVERAGTPVHHDATPGLSDQRRVSARLLRIHFVAPTPTSRRPAGTRMKAVHQTARPTPVASAPTTSHRHATLTPLQ